MSFFLLYHGYLFLSLYRKIILLCIFLRRLLLLREFRALHGQTGRDVYRRMYLLVSRISVRDENLFHFFPDRLLERWGEPRRFFPIKRRSQSPNWKGWEADPEKIKWWKDPRSFFCCFWCCIHISIGVCLQSRRIKGEAKLFMMGQNSAREMFSQEFLELDSSCKSILWIFPMISEYLSKKKLRILCI